MIQPAALPATAALSLGAALQIGQAGESGIPGGFADLLASTLNGDTPPAAPSDKVPAEALIAGLVAARQVPGKVAGKTLPDALPAAEDAPIEEEAAAETTDTAEAAPVAPSPVPFSLAMLNAIVLPQTESEAPAASHVAAETTAVAPAKTGETKAGPVEARSEAPQPKTETTLATASLTVALPESQRIAQRLQLQPTETAAEATPPAETRSAAAAQPTAPAIVLQATGNAIAPKAAAARKDTRKADEEAATKVATTVATAPASTAETLRQRPAASGEVAAATPRAAATITPDLATADPIAQVGAELQPMIAVRDAPAAQASTLNAGPAAPAALAQQGHDFAALVDRLVEARDAASPQTVSAAIRHAEFGQVSLRFDQGDNGLSVAMTSADPDFARAVQAAAPAGQTATSDNDNGGNSSSSQNATGNASAQTQGQAQGQSQSSTRDGQTAQSREETGRTSASRRANDRGADEGEQPGSTRDGIYA